MKRPYILAIESSCDDTSIALLGENTNEFYETRHSQIKLHNEYGGVVPELASREHFEQMEVLYKEFIKVHALQEKIKLCRKVVATVSPGLMGPLLVGSSFARALASAYEVPFEGIHHLRAHMASVLLNYQKESSGDSLTFKEAAHKVFPSLVLLVSGGHTAIFEVQPDLSCVQLAETADDAAGECFDKTAKLMGLDYPGGPQIEAQALLLKESEIQKAKELFKLFPVPRAKEGFSFSGLKTAIRLKFEEKKETHSIPVFAWAVQKIIAKTLKTTLARKLQQLSEEKVSQYKSVVFCGGVSANQLIRSEIEELAQRHHLKLMVPPLKYCTDNAAMIGACAQVQSSDFILDDVAPRIPL